MVQSRTPALAWDRIRLFASLAFCGLLPLLVVLGLFADAIRDDAVAFDFRVFYAAAQDVLWGDAPYPPLGSPNAAVARGYVYPPLTAIIVTPLTAFPVEIAGLIVMALLVAVALAIPWALGVRDWRCYGLVLLWPPVISSIQTGSVTLFLGLGAALAWRFRDRRLVPSAAIGLTLVAKFFLWPLAIWLAVTRRWLQAALSVVIGVALVLLSWAAIGFDGFLDYPALLRKLEHAVGGDSYTTYILGLDLGVPSPLSRALWLALGLGLLAAIVVFARRGDDRSAFILAIAASLALTPIVWLHYFALLVVVVALAQPRLGVLWLIPLAMIVTPGSGHPTPLQTSATLVVAAVTIALALRSTTGEDGGLARASARLGVEGA